MSDEAKTGEVVSGKPYTVETFQDQASSKMFVKPAEKLGGGEVDIHSPGSADRVSGLLGTPVDDKTFVPDPLQVKVDKVEADKKTAAPAPIAPPAEGIARILIVIPILQITYEFFQSFTKFWQDILTAGTKNRPVGPYKGYEIGWYPAYRKPLHIAETAGVNIARDSKATHVLLMDDDIYDTKVSDLEKLLAADKDVISGFMYASGFPYAGCTFRRYNLDTSVCSQPAQKGMYRLYEIPCRCPHCAKEGNITQFSDWTANFCPVCKKDVKDLAIQPVDLIPFPFTLIKMSVFDKIKTPWFHCNSIFPTDSWFADRCIEAGIQEYAHMAVRLNHRGITDVTKPFRFQEGMAVNKTESRVVEITPEQMKMHEVLMEQKLNDAEEKAKILGAPKYV